MKYISLVQAGMNKFRLFDEAMKKMILIGTGNHIDNNMVIQLGSSTYECHITRSFNSVRAILNKKTRMGGYMEIASLSYGRFAGAIEDRQSSFRLMNVDSELWEFAFIKGTEKCDYNVRVGNDCIEFLEHDLEEYHFQMSTVERVPHIEYCKRALEFKEEFDCSCDLELGFVTRASIHTSCTEMEAKLLLKVLTSTGEMGDIDDF